MRPSRPLAAAPERLADWLPKIRSREYDPRFVPFWEKTAVTLGMGMTEKQGGTDVRANTTRAVPVAGDEYALTGHKWFMSAPMCDAFLVLAQAPAGSPVSCCRASGRRDVNGLHLRRLKDKLGNRSNASSEVEFAGAFAWRIGEEGRGVTTILRMVQLTRLDCAVASAGLVRMALALAHHHARHREMFRQKLIDQPPMRGRAGRPRAGIGGDDGVVPAACGQLRSGPEGGAGGRLRPPHDAAAKFGICKAAPRPHLRMMECLGGNGYVEESPMPRLYREAPVNAIWEGSGNVIALDILRAENREPEDATAVLARADDETLDGPPGAPRGRSAIS